MSVIDDPAVAGALKEAVSSGSYLKGDGFVVLPSEMIVVNFPDTHECEAETSESKGEDGRPDMVTFVIRRKPT